MRLVILQGSGGARDWLIPEAEIVWTPYLTATVDGTRVTLAGADRWDLAENGIGVTDRGGKFRVSAGDGELFLQALAWFFRDDPAAPMRFQAEGFTINDEATLVRRLERRPAPGTGHASV